MEFPRNSKNMSVGDGWMNMGKWKTSAWAKCKDCKIWYTSFKCVKQK